MGGLGVRIRWVRTSGPQSISCARGNAAAVGLQATVTGQSAPTAPTITSPAFLVAGTVNTVYPSTTFTASGTAPITWSYTGTLPAGMAFSSAGVLSGTPTATASGLITFTATNAYGSANTSLTLTVNAAAAFDILVNVLTAGKRGDFNVPIMENVTVGAVTTSMAVKITGLGAAPVSSQPAITSIAPQGGRGVTISVDGGPYLDTDQPISEGSIIRCRVTAPYADWSTSSSFFWNAGSVIFGGCGAWSAKTGRAPEIKQVGSGKTYATIEAAINSGLYPGDTVEVYSGTYSGSMTLSGITAAACVTTNGTPSLPITFKGMGVARPIINCTSSSNRAFLIKASYINVQNFQFNGTGQDYVQVQQLGGNFCKYDQCFFNGDVSAYSGNAYLSNDTGNGTQIFTRCEFKGFGGNSYDGPAEHGIYASGNHQAYPNLYLEVNSCYFDYILNNSVKSRVKNNKIYFNTFVSRPGATVLIGGGASGYVATAYAIECIRNYERSLDGYSTSDIFGNLIVRNTQGNSGGGNTAAIRTDDDGQGPSYQKVRFVNNSVWFDSSYNTYNEAVIKATGTANTQYHQNNAIINQSGSASARNVFDLYLPYYPAGGWIGGRKLTLINNWYPPSSFDRSNESGSSVQTAVTYGGPPNNVSGSNGVQSATFATLDMTPSAGSGLIAAGTSIASMPADYAIPEFNSALNRKPLPLTFVSGTTIDYQSQSVTLPIGAIGV